MSQMPTWEGFLRFCLLALQDGQVRGRQELNALAAAEAKLGPDQIAEILSSGQPMYANRIGWALSFLANVGALKRRSGGTI